MVAVAYGVLIRPLPYPDAATLVVLQAKPGPDRPATIRRFAVPELRDWMERSRAFESLALYNDDTLAVNGDTGLERVAGSRVSARFFETLGATLLVGRPIAPEAPEAIVSERFWRSHLAADPHVLGRQLGLNGAAYTIVGVTRREFQFPSAAADVWTLLDFAAPRLETANRRARSFGLIARSRAGLTLDQVQADATRVAQSLARDYPESNGGVSVAAVPLAEYLVGGIRPALLLLLCAVAFVLVIACANVANLLLVRQASRAREMAVRAALGASTARLLRQLTAEGALLAIGGTATGILIARAVTAALAALQPSAADGARGAGLLPRIDAIRIDGPVALFAAGVALLVILLTAIAPSMQLLSGRSLALRGSAGATHAGGPVFGRLRSALVVAQLALSLMLLVGAGLLVRSFARLVHTSIGAATEHVAAMEVNVAMTRAISRAHQIALAETVLQKVKALPGVTAAGAASMFPVSGIRMTFWFAPPDGRTGAPGIEQPFGLVNPTPGYFAALGIPLLRGRLFAESDGPDSLPVTIVSAGAARRFFGSIDAVGRRLPYPNAPTIVGVVGDVKYGALSAASGEVLYRPFTQYPFRNLFVAIRTSGDPLALAGDLRRVAHTSDPEIMTAPLRTLDQIVSDTVAEPRLRTVTLATMAVLAVSLAAVGLYGFVSYSVARRTSEIGVRMALGASSRDIGRLVMGDGARLVAAGVSMGAGGAYLLSRFLAGFLYGVGAFDAVSFALAAAAVAATALAATYVPARHATRVDPLVALRCE